jgi:hypothetical protein
MVRKYWNALDGSELFSLKHPHIVKSCDISHVNFLIFLISFFRMEVEY